MKIYKVKVNGKVYEVELESVTETSGSIQTPVKTASAGSGTGVEVKAPVAGTILEVKVQVGQQIKRGQVIAILEAMKLENEVVSTADGIVKQVAVSKGQVVVNQQLLIVVG